MPKWTAAIADQLAANCRHSSQQLAAAISDALGTTLQLEVSEPETFAAAQLMEARLGAGLLLEFSAAGESLIAVLPEDGGLLPTDSDSQTGESFRELADRINEFVMTGELAAEKTDARMESDLTECVRHATNGQDVIRLDLVLANEEQTGLLRIIWQTQVQEEELAGAADSEAAGKPQVSASEPSDQYPMQYPNLDEGIRQLPAYARSLLKIKVPVRVTLAETQLPVDHILNLGSGSIIQFKKSCEDTLTLEAGEQQIAQGEAVKVGDKFGLWITSIALPAERFFVLQGQGEMRRVQ